MGLASQQVHRWPAMLRLLAAGAALFGSAGALTTPQPCDGLWTPEAANGQIVFKIEAGVLHWTTDLLSQVTSSSNFGITIDLQGSDEGLHSDAELQDGANKMLWSNGDVWVRLLDTASLQELRDLLRHTAWTEKPQPGQHIYAFSDTHVSGDNLSPTPFTFTRDHTIVTQLGGQPAKGKLVNGEIVWDQGTPTWIPIPFDKLDNRWWTQESQPGKNIYVVTQGVVQGGDLNATDMIATADGTIFSKLRGQDCVGQLESNGDILWENSTGEGRWLSLLLPDEVRSRLEGLRWTEEEHPWDRTFSVSGLTFLGWEVPLPFVMLPDGRLFTQLKDAKSMTSGKMLDNGEIHWEGEGNPIWVTIAAIEEMNYQIDGKRWTEKVNPGPQIYTISNYMVAGASIPAKFTLLPDRSIVSGLPQKPTGTMLDNWDIQWGEPHTAIGDENTWLPLASKQDMDTKIHAHEWTTVTAPNQELYTVQDDMVEGNGQIARFAMLTDNRIFTGLKGKESGRLLQNGEIVWDSGDAAWVPMDAVQAMDANVEGKRWTDKAGSGGVCGQRLYTVIDGMINDGISAPSSFQVLPDSRVYTDLGQRSKGEMKDSGEIQWAGSGGAWVPVASPGLMRQKLEGMMWSGSDTAAATKHVYMVQGDRVLRDMMDMNVTIVLLADATHICTSAATGITEGVLQPNGEIVWTGGNLTWAPMSSAGPMAGNAPMSSAGPMAGNATIGQVNSKVEMPSAPILPKSLGGTMIWGVSLVAAATVAASLVSGAFRRRRGVRGSFALLHRQERCPEPADVETFSQVLLATGSDADLAGEGSQRGVP